MQLLLLLGDPRRLCDRVQPEHRVVDVARQRDEHPRDLVPQRLRLPLGARRDRHHRDQRLLGLLPAGRQEPTQTTRDAGQDDVVHGRLEDPPDLLDVVERQGERGEPLAVGDGAVERGTRRSEEAGRRLFAPLAPAHGCASRGRPPPPPPPAACSGLRRVASPVTRRHGAASARSRAAAPGSTPAASARRAISE